MTLCDSSFSSDNNQIFRQFRNIKLRNKNSCRNSAIIFRFARVDWWSCASATCIAHICALCRETVMMELKKLSFVYSIFFAIAVASPPDRRVTRDDIGVASAGAAANNATGCSSTSGAASTRPRNPSSSPGRNGQLSSKFSRHYLSEICFSTYRPDLLSASVFQRASISKSKVFSSFFCQLQNAPKYSQ